METSSDGTFTSFYIVATDISYSLETRKKTRARTHTHTKVRAADVCLRWRNVFLIFISGFGSQSWHLVTVMEQSIRDTAYEGIKGGGAGGG